jgi:phosphoribosylglycinamide formyltransferase-1
MKEFRLAIFASGNGSNAEAIMAYFKDHVSIEVAVMMTNNANAFAIERAKKSSVPYLVFDKQQFRESDEVLNWLRDRSVTHLVLAGFLWLMPEKLIQEFPERIVNIHPSLLPKFGGKGMYGMNVHKAVKEAGEKITGMTIHLVNAKYDDGKVLAQEKCEIDAADSSEQIAAKVNALEYKIYPPTIERWVMS